MITIRDFADEMGCSVANIYKHIKNNQKELDDHIIKRGSKQFLDEEAQAFLKTLITPKSLVVEDQELLDELNRLRAVVVDLTQKNNELVNKNAQLLVERSKIDSKRVLLEKDINTLEQDKKELIESSNELRDELNSYHKSLFGFYRKKK